MQRGTQFRWTAELRRTTLWRTASTVWRRSGEHFRWIAERLRELTTPFMTNHVNSRTVAACPSDVANAARPAPKRDRSQDLDHKWSCFKLQTARRGVVHGLTLGHFSTIVQMPCAHCGHGANDRHASVLGIDRIDRSVREYSLRNCVPSCSTCNFMTMSLHPRVFLNKDRAIAAWRTGVHF